MIKQYRSWAKCFGGPQLGRAKSRGVPGEKPLKTSEIFIPKIAVNASNFKTSSYIWRTHLLLPFSSRLSINIGVGARAPPPAPPLATALLKSNLPFYFLAS